MHNDRDTQATLFSDALDLLCDGLEARPHRLHEEEFLFFGELEQVSGLRCVGGGGFLAQNVLPGEESSPSILVVQGVWCADVDRVHVLDQEMR